MTPKSLSSIAVLLALSGCASVNIDQSIERTNVETAALTGGSPARLLRTAESQTARDRQVAGLLRSALNQQTAVQLAVLNSPALQTLLAERWDDMAVAAQGGRIANPLLTLERVRLLDELEFGRLLAFGLLDVLTLPQRSKVATARITQAELQMTTDVVGLVTQVRMAWVSAVAANETLMYAQRVYESAQASAELARRMQSVGNFSRLQRARQQAFYADAAAQLLVSQQAATSARESLIRLLGLNEAQVGSLSLPERLPDLPASFLTPQTVGKALTAQRLDVRMAQSQLEAASKAQGLTLLTSLSDIELGVRRDTVTDLATDTQNTRKGYEVSVRLPLFDWGDAQRASMNARTLAAANRLEATLNNAGSDLRSSYAAYRTAYDLSRHYRDELLPLRKVISEENGLLYNGMLIAVFELLADNRDQIRTVMAAIAAQQQFWLSDAVLQATLLGKPMSAPAGAMRQPASAEAPAH